VIPFKAFRFLLPLVVREKAVISFGILLILVTSISQVAVPRLIGMAVERLESGIGIDLVIPIAMAMLGAVLIRGITSFWTRKTVIGSSRRIEKNLRDQMFRHIETLDGSFHAKIHTGDLMSRFNSDVDAVRMIFGPAIMYSVQTIFIIIFSITLMLQIDWQLTLWSLIPLALITLEVRFIGPKIHDRSKIGQEMLADISVHAQENFANAPVVKAFVIEDAEIDRMHRHSHNYFLQSLRIARVRAIATSSFGLFGDLALVTLLLLGGMRIITGDLSLGEFATFNGCQLLLIWPMIALGWVINLFHRGAASAKRLQDILDSTPTVDDSRSDHEMTVERGEIRFDQVSFRYPESNDSVLHQISFDLPGGKTLGIVGATASGKTSLLNLIPRLAPTPSGSIFIDQVPVEQFSLDALRSSIAMVPQEPFLFSATIADNISFGVDDASMDDIISVSRLVKMDDEINKFPSRYDQRVGERGVTLSGGQKQRIAIARAILQRPLILILDDVLSAVDSETETTILEGLKDWTKNLTALIVTHRLSAITHADEIIVLDKGRIIERGDHESLRRMKGRYHKMWRRQTVESELEDLE